MPDFSLHRLWGSPCSRIFIVSACLAPISIGASMLLGFVFSLFISAPAAPPGTVSAIAQEGLGLGEIISALAVAPILENAICLMLARGMDGWTPRNYLMKPAAIALIMGSLHSLVFWDVRPFAVTPMFFVIACSVVCIRNTRCGYWSSVMHHTLFNCTIFLALLMD